MKRQEIINIPIQKAQGIKVITVLFTKLPSMLGQQDPAQDLMQKRNKHNALGH